MDFDRLAPIPDVSARAPAPDAGRLGARAGQRGQRGEQECGTSGRVDHGPVTPDPMTWMSWDEKSTTTRSRKPPSKTSDAPRTR